MSGSHRAPPCADGDGGIVDRPWRPGPATAVAWSGDDGRPASGITAQPPEGGAPKLMPEDERSGHADDLRGEPGRVRRSPARRGGCARDRGGRRRGLDRVLSREERRPGRGLREGAGRRRAVEPELGLGAAAGAGPRGAPHRHGVEPDLAGARRGDRGARSRLHRVWLPLPRHRSRTDVPLGGMARDGVAPPARITPPHHAAGRGARPRSERPVVGGNLHPERRPGRAFRGGAGARPRGPPARRGRRRELRGAHGGDSGGEGRRSPYRAGADGRAGGGARGRGVEHVLRLEPRHRPAAAHGPRHGGTNQSGNRRGEPRCLLSRALPPAPGGRGVHGRGRRPHRALRRTALVPLPREVPGPPRSEREEPPGPRRSAAGISGKLGGADGAGPRTRSPRSRGRGC